MTFSEIAHYRLQQQQIYRPQFKQPLEVVKWLGAVQAQDYLGALWAVGLRLPKAQDTDVEQALDDRAIVRTWPMRGTLHFVPAADVRWMLALLTPRIVSTNASRLRRDFELDHAVFTKSKKVFAKVLQEKKQLTRTAMYEALENASIPGAGQRGLHILWSLAQEGFICFGSREGKQPTFVLLDEWIPSSKTLHKEEAMAKLSLNYFTGHGPATLQDFIWWSGLTPADAKTGLEMVKSSLTGEKFDDRIFWRSANPTFKKGTPSVHLLPSYDEFMIGYTDRSASLDGAGSGKKIKHGNGIFTSIVVAGGKVMGTWRRTFSRDKVNVEISPFRSVSRSEADAIAAAATKYAGFVDKELAMKIRRP